MRTDHCKVQDNDALKDVRVLESIDRIEKGTPLYDHITPFSQRLVVPSTRLHCVHRICVLGWLKRIPVA